MKKVTQIVLGAAIAAAVVGGAVTAYAATTATDGDSQVGASLETSSPSSTPSSTPAPDVSAPAPTDSATPWPYTEVPDGQARFLTAVKSPGTLLGIDVPSDADLIANGLAACNQLAAGVSYDDVRVIADNPNPVIGPDGIAEGKDNSSPIADLASELLCTEYNIEDVPATPLTDG